MPNVSIIIPAWNAAATLQQALDSASEQTHSDLEVVVVDDGSTDHTAAIVQRQAARDPRFRLLKTAHGGVAAARNKGLSAAQHELVLFLDADDLLLPTMLERTVEALQADPAAAAAYTGWGRLAGDGTLVRHRFFDQSGDLFHTLAGVQPFVVHACLSRRQRLLEIGGWDPTLVTGEDWDLWQRLARTGGRFISVPEELALYRMTPGSASQSPGQMLRDGLRIIAQAQRPDPRVPNPCPRHDRGAPPDLLRPHRFRQASWSAGLALGQAVSPAGLLDWVGPDDRCPTLDPSFIADTLFQSVLLPQARTAIAWLELWPALQESVDAYLDELEKKAGAPDLARGARARLEASTAQLVVDEPRVVGRTYVHPIELTEPIADLTPPTPVQRLHARLHWNRAPMGQVELPVFHGRVTKTVLADAIADRVAWSVLRELCRQTLLPQLRLERLTDRVRVWREQTLLADGLPSDIDPGAVDSLFDAIGWTYLLQELWDRPSSTLAELYAPAPPPDGLERASHPQRITLEVSSEAPTPSSDHHALDCLLTVGGVVTGKVVIPVPSAELSAAYLQTEITRRAGFELARVAVREGLLGQPIDSTTRLRSRLRAAASRRTQPASPRATASRRTAPASPRATLERRLAGALDTSISRHALLPATAWPELVRAAQSAREPVSGLREPPTGPVQYRPDRTERTVARDEPPSPRPTAPATGPATTHLPILMYHRILRGPTPHPDPFSLSARAFEEQLAFLRALGFASICPSTWREALSTHQPLPGRAVLLTFDDATRDFATAAWPLLRRYGFTATLFVTTAAAQRGSFVDPLHQRVWPALGFAQLRELVAQGLEVGSHSQTHPFLTRRSPSEVVTELAGSRAILQEELGAPVRALAYPFGDEDDVVRHLAGACGYLYGFTCQPTPSHLWDPMMALPRIDVSSTERIGEFAAKIGLPAAPPLEEAEV